MLDRKRMVVAISGASGAQLGIDLLQVMQKISGWETHLIMSKGAERTIELETSYTPDEVKAMADMVYPIGDIGANVASGTFKVDGMVIVPCSMKTLAGISAGYSDNLILRAADVNIKEKRKLVLVARESPLSPIHLRNMLDLANLGAIIMPPMLTLYNHPQSIEDMSRHVLGKVLNVFDLELPGFKRWGEKIGVV